MAHSQTWTTTWRWPLLRLRVRRRPDQEHHRGLRPQDGAGRHRVQAEHRRDGKYIIKKLPGRWKAGECTLTRALTDDQSFDKWVKDSQLGKMDDVRKNGFVIVYDYEGKAVKRYKLTQCLAEDPRDRLDEGRRHQRPDREAGPHLREV